MINRPERVWLPPLAGHDRKFRRRGDFQDFQICGMGDLAMALRGG
jgi:hypothetical protein